ncbi:phosphate ABC transporter permease PstA [Halorientalis salina]|uniref:phosphate ABC transporter permease PstA n=1 Tax=Halorientalis salina TaxID=2932266 RepID=UPI0010AD2635|nr:phosphate ABC transporter permease PstA [Halorientalis salina]
MATQDGLETSREGDQQVSRMRGRIFEAMCLAATAIGLVAVGILLLYVTADAIRPFSADPGWHLVFFATLVVPSTGFGLYLYARDGNAGKVAYTALGLGLIGVLLAGALVILFVEIFPYGEWFALSIALAILGAVTVVHRRYRRHAETERTGLLIVTLLVTVFGIPPGAIAELLGLPFYIPSVRGLIASSPVLPLDWIMLVPSLVLPVAAAAGWFVRGRRESNRAGLVTAGAVIVGSVLGVGLGPVVGVGVEGWMLIVLSTAVPLGLYVESVLRRDEGRLGLLFPVVLVGGTLLGAVLTRTLGFAGPDPWLDWGFLTSATSTTPADAGIYPVMVGSIMLLIVIVLTTFPVGVGAAIYLEEYAPSSGLMGRLVTLIEINIGNLAGVPSVVYGLLGLALFVRFFQMPTGSVIVGGLAVGLLILPIIIISAQEAIRSVPDSMREASYGMGATRWQTVRNVVLPEALPGILTGTILAFGRAIGETAPLLMIGMAASVRVPPNGFFSRSGAMPRQIFQWARQFDPAFLNGVLPAGVVTLVFVLLVMNGTAIIIRNRYQRGS